MEPDQLTFADIRVTGVGMSMMPAWMRGRQRVANGVSGLLELGYVAVFRQRGGGWLSGYGLVRLREAVRHEISKSADVHAACRAILLPCGIC